MGQIFSSGYRISSLDLLLFFGGGGFSWPPERPQGLIFVLSICNNRLCAVSAKGDRTSKTGGMVRKRSLCSLPFALVPLWSLSQKGHWSTSTCYRLLAQGRKVASLDTPPSRACGVSIHIEKSKLGVPTHIHQSQLNSARFLASRDHNVAIDLVL